jgi:proline iminopeptidase
MDRRSFLTTAATSVAAGAVAACAKKPAPSASTSAATSAVEAITTPKPDGLNPVGIRTAGIRMLSVMGGKYKVWTKRVGQGPVKVLLLAGGPGCSHEYLTAMESFLPEAGIEMIYYDQLGTGNADQPNDTRSGTFRVMSRRWRRSARA